MNFRSFFLFRHFSSCYHKNLSLFLVRLEKLRRGEINDNNEHHDDTSPHHNNRDIDNAYDNDAKESVHDNIDDDNGAANDRRI